MPSRPATRRCRCHRGGRSLRRARRRSADELDVLDAGARRGLSGAGKRRAAASPREKGRGPAARRIALRAGGRGCFVQTLQARSDGASQARVGGRAGESKWGRQRSPALERRLRLVRVPRVRGRRAAVECDSPSALPARFCLFPPSHPNRQRGPAGPAPRIGRVDPGARSRSAGPQALLHAEGKGRVPDRVPRLALPPPKGTCEVPPFGVISEHPAGAWSYVREVARGRSPAGSRIAAGGEVAGGAERGQAMPAETSVGSQGCLRKRKVEKSRAVTGGLKK